MANRGARARRLAARGRGGVGRFAGAAPPPAPGRLGGGPGLAGGGVQEAADYWDHSVTQTAGKYPDEAAARTVFDALVAGVRDCTG
ncbi:sensor domain-containing protein, partial [Mycolicibacterium hippocampi]|uniref:sensor domain-containing protein n=1 Tax=Mycolicibacterium hippocampi TaxID=659824 RepID=UPI0021F31070